MYSYLRVYLLLQYFKSTKISLLFKWDGPQVPLGSNLGLLWNHIVKAQQTTKIAMNAKLEVVKTLMMSLFSILTLATN